jgi:hypothetical protein
MPDRREALKIIGAIGTTCAFPFSGAELYGQHVHPPAGASAEYGPPKFFTPSEFQSISHLTDLIIPQTDTPGAVAAGVPAYIDYVVNTNEEWRNLFRQGLSWLGEKQFASMSKERQIELLTPLVDSTSDELPARFARALKAMTADGYYTSRIGLMEDLGYKGNTVRDSFPSCEIPEH